MPRRSRWAETRRTQRLAPRHPSQQVVHHRHCDARGAHPTCQQIDNAKQIAAATATQLLNAALNLPILQVFLVGNGAALLRGFLSWIPPWWIPAALADAAKAIVAVLVTALAAIMAQLLVASVLFQAQSSEPDAFWESVGEVSTSRSLIEMDIAALGLAIAALGIAVLALTSNPLTIPIGAGLIFGGLVGLIPVFKIALNGLAREQQALGY